MKKRTIITTVATAGLAAVVATGVGFAVASGSDDGSIAIHVRDSGPVRSDPSDDAACPSKIASSASMEWTLEGVSQKSSRPAAVSESTSRMAFAASMGEPPPTATTLSQAATRYCSSPSSTFCSVGFGSTDANTGASPV